MHQPTIGLKKLDKTEDKFIKDFTDGCLDGSSKCITHNVSGVYEVGELVFRQPNKPPK
jgi:hypothetical protein